MAGDVAYDETHDLLFNAFRALLDRVANGDIELGRREAARRNRRQIHESARGIERVEGVDAPLEIELDEPLSRQTADPLLDQLAPRIRARVVNGAGVVGVRRD